MSIINDALKKVQTKLDKNVVDQKIKTVEQTPHVDPKPTPQRKEIEKSSPSQISEEKPAKRVIPASSLPAKKEEVRITLHKSFVFMVYLGFIITGILIAFFMYSWNRTSSSLQNTINSLKAIQTPVTTTQGDSSSKIPPVSTYYPKGTLIVSGTMKMGDKIVALINEDIYELGDMIDGKKIVNISSKEIELLDFEGKMTTINVRGRR